MPTKDTTTHLRRLVACAGLIVAAAASAQSPHVVKPGETLWGISGQQLATPLRWPEVQQRNQVGEPRLLQPGTVLYFADGRLVPEGAAVVAAVEGRASRKRAGVPEQILTPGMPIQAGDTLITGTDAFVTLGVAGGSRVVLPSRSALEVLAIDANTVRLRLIEGRVESQVHKQQPNQQFEIRARSMGLGVRGTHFRVRDEDGVLTGEVIVGEVVVQRTAQSDPPLVLREGRGAVLLENGPSQATGLLPAPQLVAETTARNDRTFRFTPVPGAQTYRLQLARDERFLLPVHEQRGPGPSFAVPAELASGLYQLRLTAFDAARLEGLPGDGTVYLPTVEGGAGGQGTSSVLSDGRVEVRWPGVSGQRYSFELSRSADFAVLLLNEPSVYATGMTVGPFALGGRYHWRARQATADGATPAAAAFGGSFDIPVR
ncbi:FecR domain-containing protein [Variovorax sp. 38R]|uniref:FecR domain-containing protein n=1 Tax=Variovorax sp. 38R TaxID=2774875 RepID=UPI001783622F|nr:FecR domain-containing protein [Variovorax sp. 38R]QOF80406.1 FecR domain-containing protein [Variovorax sp. 38R]